MKRILFLLCAVSFFLLLILPGFAAETDYLLSLDFEKDDPGTSPTQSASFACVPLSASLKIQKIDGRNVLCFSRKQANGNTAAYVDLLTGSKKFAKTHVVSYEIKVPSGQKTAGTWQIACSRQTPSAGTQFQQAGTLNLVSGEIQYSGKAAAKMTLDEWHTLAAVFDELRAIYDVYLDGVCVLSAAPYTINTAARYPERLRVGQNSSTGDCVVYVDNLKVYNGAAPENLVPASVEVVAEEEIAETAPQVTIPVWTRERDVNTLVVSAVGSVSIVLVGILAVIVLLRGRKGKPGDPSSPSNT